MTRRRARVLLGSSAALGTLALSCSLANLDYLRDPTCAPNCGHLEASDEPSAADGGVSDPRSDGADVCSVDAGYRALVLCDGPLAYYRLGESAPPSATNEVSGGVLGSYASEDGGAIQFGAPGAIVGDPDTAIGLDGTGRVSLGDAFTFDGSSPYSIEAWVAPNVVDGYYRRIVERITFDGQGTVDGYLMVSQTDAVAFDRFVAHELNTAHAAPLGQNAYSHLVGTFDGSKSHLYVNGSLQGTSDAGPSMPARSAVFLIGNTAAAQGGFVGRIDEVAIYGSALTPAQVSAHYRAGRGL